MNIHFLVLTALFCSSPILAKGDSRSVEDVREESNDEFDQGLEQAQLAGVGFWLGGVLASKGNVLGAASSIGGGMVCTKEAYRHFKKSNNLSVEARALERETNNNENASCDDLRDRVDSWDHDY